MDLYKTNLAFMRIRAVLVALAIANIFFIDMPGLAHGGGLNSQGCHNERATGGYHCHRSSRPNKTKKKRNKKDKASNKKNKKDKASKKSKQSKKGNKSSKNPNFNKKPGKSKNKKGTEISEGRLIMRCYDGDTCTTYNKENIRLACIDAPEIGSGSAAIRAKNKITDLVVGKKISIHRYEKDRYGRSVAEIFTPRGTSSNKALVKGGFAKVYTKYANNCSWAR